MNGQPRLTPTPALPVLVGEAAALIATIARAIASTTTVRAAASTTLRAGPLYICNAELLPAMHFKDTRT